MNNNNVSNKVFINTNTQIIVFIQYNYNKYLKLVDSYFVS